MLADNNETVVINDQLMGEELISHESPEEPIKMDTNETGSFVTEMSAIEDTIASNKSLADQIRNEVIRITVHGKQVCECTPAIGRMVFGGQVLSSSGKTRVKRTLSEQQLRDIEWYQHITFWLLIGIVIALIVFAVLTCCINCCKSRK